MLVRRGHPVFSSDFIKHNIGEAPDLPDNIRDILSPSKTGRNLVSDAGEVIRTMEEFL